RADVRMIERRSRPRLAQKPLLVFAARNQVFRKELQRHRALQLHIERAIHHAHTPGSGQAEDFVVADDVSRRQSGGRIRHEHKLPHFRLPRKWKERDSKDSGDEAPMFRCRKTRTALKKGGLIRKVVFRKATFLSPRSAAFPRAARRLPRACSPPEDRCSSAAARPGLWLFARAPRQFPADARPPPPESLPCPSALP